MAEPKNNGQNTGANAINQALTANQKEQIRLAIRTIYRDWKDPYKQDSLPPKGMSFNQATDGLVHSKETSFEEKDMIKIASAVKFKNPNLDKWTDEALEIVSKYFDVTKYKADDRQATLLEIGMKFETWFKREYPDDKRKSFKGENLKSADVIDYFIANNKELSKDLFKTLPVPTRKKALSILKTDELETLNKLMSA